MGSQFSSKPSLFRPRGKTWIIILAIVGVTTVAATAFYSLKVFNSASVSQTPPTPSPSPEIKAVSALGRLEPNGEVIDLSAPPALGGAKIAKLFVKEGDRVTKNQIVAQLDNQERLQAALERAKQDVVVAQVNVAKVRAGAKAGEINAARAEIERLQVQLKGEQETQKATLARLDAELGNAETEYERYQKLYNEGAVARADLERYTLTLDTSRQRLAEARAIASQTNNSLVKQIREAQANLDRVAEVRPIDIRQAEAEVARATAALYQAQADLELGIVRSPVNGQVLKIKTHPGESVSTEGIVQIGQTDQMIAVAEVYESDISKVRVNQPAIVTSENDAFSGELKGIVSNVGLQIGRKSILSTDPAADVDVRVIEVDILLSPQDSQKVASLTNAKVFVKIEIEQDYPRNLAPRRLQNIPPPDSIRPVPRPTPS